MIGMFKKKKKGKKNRVRIRVMSCVREPSAERQGSLVVIKELRLQARDGFEIKTFPNTSSVIGIKSNDLRTYNFSDVKGTCMLNLTKANKPNQTTMFIMLPVRHEYKVKICSVSCQRSQGNQ